ncbi:hypothetical protein D3C71_489930 [compost metagenome]
MGQLGDHACHFHARRARPDDDEGQQRLPFLFTGRQFGPFEGQQQAAADCRCIFKRLEAGGGALPLVTAKIGVARAGGQHQRIEADHLTRTQMHGPRGPIYAIHLRKQGRDLLAVTIEMADRPGDFGCRESRRRNLIKQWLEQVMITTIYQCNTDRGPLQPVYQLQTAEASTHDDNMMFLHMSLPSKARARSMRQLTIGKKIDFGYEIA